MLCEEKNEGNSFVFNKALGIHAHPCGSEHGAAHLLLLGGGERGSAQRQGWGNS